MLSQSSYLLAAARKGRASLPMNFWGIELFRFATLLANLSRTSALSLPISALMCLASTLAGLEEEGEEYIGTWGEWGRGTSWKKHPRAGLGGWCPGLSLPVGPARFPALGTCCGQWDQFWGTFKSCSLMLRWESPTHPQLVPSLARGSIEEIAWTWLVAKREIDGGPFTLGSSFLILSNCMWHLHTDIILLNNFEKKKSQCPRFTALPMLIDFWK